MFNFLNNCAKVNLYFDEDGPEIDTETGAETWTGLGEFILPDFTNLVNFLDQMITSNEIKELGNNAK